MPIGYLPLNRRLSLNGDGTGTTDFTGDYSGGSADEAYLTSGSRTLTDDLNEALDASETAVDVDDGTQWLAGDIAQVDDEKMLVTGIASNTLTVIRGVLNTTATTHTIGTDMIKPARDMVLDRMIFYIADTAAGDGSEYGDLGVALTNGLKFTIQDASGNEIIDIAPGNIKTNGDIAALCYDFQSFGFAASTAYFGRWTFSKFTPDGIVLNDGDRLVCDLQDNFTGLVSNIFTVQGHFMETYSSVSSVGLMS